MAKKPATVIGTMKALAVANQKGGVGKSTIARHLFFHGVEQGYRVLGVDLDPQKNFTKTLRYFAERNLGASEEGTHLTASALFEGAAVKLKPMPLGQGAGLIAADDELVDVAQRPLEDIHAPRAALATLAAEYDLCVIDTAPTLGQPLYAALIAADFVVCPCTMDQDAIDGLERLFADIGRVQQIGWNSNLVTLGLLANCVDPRRAFERNALEQLREELGDTIMQSVVYDRAATKFAKERPVWSVQSGESRTPAAREMRAVCTEIFGKITD